MSDRDREQGEVQEQLDDRQTKQMEDKQDTKQKEEKSNTKTDEGKTKQKTEDEKPKQNSQTNEKQDVKADQADDEGSEAGGRKQKEFFREELKRLQNSLQQEKSKIHKPKERDYYPYTFTSLEPYYNTYVASYLIELNDEQPHGFITRNTAQGLCDPWIALRMDKEILPKLETSSKNPSTASSSKSHKKQGKEKNRPPKEGSTRLPKFPVVNFNAGKENATKQFPYSEIPQFREEMRSKFSPHAQNKVDSDYNRTKQDFYRMELDKIDEIHPLNRPHMRKAYFAYLQNTPGSRKAIKECAKSLPPCK